MHFFFCQSGILTWVMWTKYVLSVNKGCCGHKALRDGIPTPIPRCALRGFRREKTGYWPWIVKMHVKRMVSGATSLVIRWVRPGAPNARSQVSSLVGELDPARHN